MALHTELNKPGEEVEISGLYRQYTPDPKRVTCTKGEPFPPTTEDGSYWMLEEATNEPGDRS